MGEIELNDFNDYIHKSKELGSLKKIKPKHVFLNGKPNTDVFYFPFTSTIYISNKLHKALVDAEFTGIKFNEESSISVLKSEV